jgi:hypothetical protein
MGDRKKAEVLSRYLDGLLQGEGNAGVDAMDEEVQALGELGQSLTNVEFQPRPVHRAAVERMLLQGVPQRDARSAKRISGRRRSTMQRGGPKMAHWIWGAPLRWFLAVVTTLAGSGLVLLTAAQGGLLPTEIVNPETPTPALTLEEGEALVLPTDALPAAEEATDIRPLLAEDTPDLSQPPDLPQSSEPAELPEPPEPSQPAGEPDDEELSSDDTDDLLTQPGMAGLAFHPAHLNAGGQCSDAYSAQGSLKNHGPGMLGGISIAYSVQEGGQWVNSVAVTPDGWDELGMDQPGRFRVTVSVNEDWAQAGKGSQIVVKLAASGGDSTAEAVFVVGNQCQPEKDTPDQADKADKDKPDKPGQPENPGKPDDTGKPDDPGQPDNPGNSSKPDSSSAAPSQPSKPDKPDNSSAGTKSNKNK